MIGDYAQRWFSGRSLDESLVIAEAPGRFTPWRTTKLKILKTGGPWQASPDAVDLQDPENEALKAIPETDAADMRLIATVDVGDPVSESGARYRISGLSWQGSREFAYLEGHPFVDDGKAHRGAEKVTLRGLHPGRAVLIVKRFDPAVSGQAVAVRVNGKPAGHWQLNGSSPGSGWDESTFLVPPELINAPRVTFVFSFLSSQHDVNSFYYWFFQEN